MARSGPVVLVAAAAVVVACTFSFEVPGEAQISCVEEGPPCPDGWECDAASGRCVVRGSVPEIPEIRIAGATPLSTTESGGVAALAVTLGATPTAPVRIPVVSTRPGEATVSPSELTFTASTWNQAQTVTVQGVRDSLLDGNQPYEVVLGPAASDDVRYGALPQIRIAGTNADTDVAQIVTVPTTVNTSESDTQSTPIQVYLSAKPSGVVIVPVSGTDPGEATVTPASLAFDAGNWSTPQTARVTGVDDSQPVADGRRPYNVQLGPSTSADTSFQGITATVAGFNDDNDSPGVRIDRSTGLDVYENFGSDYFYVSLFTQPSADVTVTFTSLTPGEVAVEPPASVTFDAGNWNYPQYVNITGVNDDYDDALDQTPFTVRTSNAVSADPNYNGFDVVDVTGVSTDDDYPGVLFHVAGSPSGSINPNENAAPVQVTLTLRTRPRGQVTIYPSSGTPAKVTVSPPSITLDGNNWSTGLPMTITLVDNQVREYDPAVPINFAPVTATAQDPGYQGLMVSPFYVYIRDDERIIFTLSTPQTGNMAPGFNPTVADPDYLCSNDPPAYMELFGYPRALVAAPGSEFTRIASVTPNQGDGQVNWVLTTGHNYIRDTRNGPVIGRANSRNLLDFPLQNAPTTSTSYWTGLNADWTTSASHCIDWVNNAAAFSGQAGAGGTTAGAISSGPATCNTTRTILCVES